MDDGLKIDIGCGAAKREGFIGIDYVALPGVDHVLDVNLDPLPFPDASVSHVYSAHFFEHIGLPNHVLMEIARVCRDGATIEIVTPYAFSSDAFVYGHVTILTELPWLHFCVSHRDAHLDMLKGRWLLNSINFVVHEHVEAELLKNGFSVDFAIKYFKGVVLEFCVEMTFTRDLSAPVVFPKRTYSRTRTGARQNLDSPGTATI